MRAELLNSTVKVSVCQKTLSQAYSLIPTDVLGLVSRLVLSLLVGGIIGIDRELRKKAAGLRTNMLVSFGSALFVLVPIQTGATQESADAISRVLQGIVAGVGFIGAGSIIHESQQDVGHKVRGLTSAAAVWISAALGTAAGCGLWELSLIGALLSLLVLNVMRKLEHLR